MIERISKWQIDRSLHLTGYDLDGANYRFLEEIFEMNGFPDKECKKLASAYAGYIRSERTSMGYEPSEYDIIDALNDITVFANGDNLKLGYKQEDTMVETLKEIESRSGSYDADAKKWIKQITGNEYKADYSKCRKEIY